VTHHSGQDELVRGAEALLCGVYARLATLLCSLEVVLQLLGGFLCALLQAAGHCFGARGCEARGTAAHRLELLLPVELGGGKPRLCTCHAARWVSAWTISREADTR
jgi:hypothetical protein